MDKRGLRHLSGSFLTACADNLTKQEKDDVARSLVEGLAFLQSHDINLGGEVKPGNIFIVKSSPTGCHAVFVAQPPTRNSGSKEESIVKLADLLEFVWTSGEVRDCLTFAQEAVLSDMRKEETNAMSLNKLSQHVAFWSKEKVLNFIIAVSDVLELKQRSHRESVEKNHHEVVGVSWHDQLDPVLREWVQGGRRRSYDSTSVADLLRLIRNLACHYYNIPPSVRGYLGPYECLGSFWTELFPRLLLHTYEAMAPFKSDTNCKRIVIFFS